MHLIYLGRLTAESRYFHSTFSKYHFNIIYDQKVERNDKLI